MWYAVERASMIDWPALARRCRFASSNQAGQPMSESHALEPSQQPAMHQDLGERLIFLISLPRSGSTLLQHLIGSHAEVGITAEPWILLPAAYALRPTGVTSTYGADIASIAINDFLRQIPDGEQEYCIAVRKMALHLYDAHMRQHDKQRFLDKTSRYYMIFPELVRIFPNAKFIFLYRNPLAMLSSFLEVMVQQDWRKLGENPGIRCDLKTGLATMAQAAESLGDTAPSVRYEDLVADPEATLRQICDKIELDFESRMLTYGDSGVSPGKLVDPKSIHKHSEAVPDYLDNWRSSFDNPQKRELARGFLEQLGRPLVEQIGYSYDELAVAAGRGGFFANLASAKWASIMTPPEERRFLDKLRLGWAYAAQHPAETLRTAVAKCLAYVRSGIRRALGMG